MQARPECKVIMMHTTPDSTVAVSPSETGPASVLRRRLLRAAASSAPLIATLPSGAALAQASAFQCLEQLKEIAAGGGPAGETRVAPEGPGGDKFLRVMARATPYRLSGGQVVTHYVFTFRGTPFSIDQDGNPWVDQGGLVGAEYDAYLLVIYHAEPDGQTPAATAACTTTPSSAPPYANCVFPVAEVETAQPGNLGLRRSCWCSINPNDTACT